MGYSIKRQFLTAAVSSLFVLGSVGVASAGVQTALNGTVKGTEWCASATLMAAQTVDGVKDTAKGDLTVLWNFSLFPQISATVTQPTLGFVFDMTGQAVRQSSKKGTFILTGTDTTNGADFEQLQMQGTYKNDKTAIGATPPENVPTQIKGKFWVDSLTTGNFADPAAIACVTSVGTFKAKGDGTQLP